MDYKGYKIEGDGTFGYQNIKTIGSGGSLPDILKGSFTRTAFAIKAIDSYVADKEEEANKPPRVQKVKLTPREVKNNDATEINDRD